MKKNEKTLIYVIGGFDVLVCLAGIFACLFSANGLAAAWAITAFIHAFGLLIAKLTENFKDDEEKETVRALKARLKQLELENTKLKLENTKKS